MFRLLDVRSLVLFCLLLATLQWAPSAHAQDEGDEEFHEPQRPRSLSQRMEQFRRDLLGQGDINDVAPSQKPMPQRNRPKPKPTGDSVAKSKPSTSPATKKNPQPTSRMVGKESQRPPQGVRVASRPKVENSPFVEAVPVRSAEESSGQPTVADETRSRNLSASSARPARQGGAFELPTPRVARAEPVEEHQDELPQEAEQEFEEESQGVVESATAPSRGDNVLFSSKSPMLSVEATGPRKVLVGREAEFNVVLRNVGEVVASGVVVKINIPAFAEVIASEPTGGNAVVPSVSEKPSVLEWKFDRLETRSTESLRLKIVPRKNIPLDLAMQWACTPETTQAVVEVQEPMLSLSLSGPREVFFGQSKIYKLTIANPGNGDAENVAVNLLPIGNTGEAPANYRLGLLRAGDSKTIDIELTARQAGTLQIKAQAFGDGGLRADVSEPVSVRRAQLKVAVASSKVKYAGTAGLYRIRVANAGDAVAESVELAALLPQDAKFLKATNSGKYVETAAKVVWQIGTMQPGDDRTYDVHCTLAAPGANSLQAVAQAGDDLTASATAVTQVEALADLKLEVRDPQGPAAVGDDVQYEVVVRNRGTKAAEGIDIVTFSSEGLEAKAVEGIEHKITAGQVSMKTIPSIGPGGETVVRIHCKADRGGNLVFRAEVSCRNPGTKLAAEETTHFYGDETVAEEAPTETPTEASKLEPPTEGEPTPATEAPASRYPTRAE